MFMSLELLTHWTLYSPPPPPPPSVFPPSFLLSSQPMTQPHGKLVPPEVYLNPTQKFTLPWPYLNRACHLFYAKRCSPLARQTAPVSLEGMYTVAKNRGQMREGERLHPAIHLQRFLQGLLTVYSGTKLPLLFWIFRVYILIVSHRTQLEGT